MENKVETTISGLGSMAAAVTFSNSMGFYQCTSINIFRIATGSQGPKPNEEQQSGHHQLRPNEPEELIRS